MSPRGTVCRSHFVTLGALLVFLQACEGPAQPVATADPSAQYDGTRQLMAVVKDAFGQLRDRKGLCVSLDIDVGDLPAGEGIPCV